MTHSEKLYWPDIREEANADMSTASPTVWFYDLRRIIELLNISSPTHNMKIIIRMLERLNKIYVKDD